MQQLYDDCETGSERMSYQSEPVSIWFDRRLMMRRSSIQGIGTFASAPIPAGQVLMLVTGGLVYSTDEWPAGRADLAAELYNEEDLSETLRILTPKLPHYYINHSCAANALDLSRSPNATQYVAWRDIAADEEVTTDYGISGRATLDRCRCGAGQCRGRVTPEDWQLPELQQRYRGYFPWYLEPPIDPAAGPDQPPPSQP